MYPALRVDESTAASKRGEAKSRPLKSVTEPVFTRRARTLASYYARFTSPSVDCKLADDSCVYVQA